MYGERQVIRAENSDALPKLTDFIWNSIVKFKPKGVLKNSGDFDGRQLRKDS